MHLTPDEQAMAEGAAGEAAAMAMRIVAEAGRIMGAERLVPIVSAHIDGCLYHGDSGVDFAERLVALGGTVAVPATLNVGALDLLHPEIVHGPAHDRAMARRLMDAYLALGCAPSWTCAPYQAGHRPGLGEHVAWGESNAVAFVNSVLGARSERTGDFLDIAAAISGRAPETGLHLDRNRRATIIVDTSAVSPALKAQDVFYPVLGAWLGAEVGSAVAAITGLDGLGPVTEDNLKALGAAAASSGSVGLFHVVGVTPEAPSLEAALGGGEPKATIALTPDMLQAARDRLSTTGADRIDAVALGSPHFSLEEFAALERLAAGKRFAVPFFVCTGRHALDVLEREGRAEALRDAGVSIVADTCVVVAPILPDAPAGTRVLMTNSGKFAHYTPANTGYEVIYGSLEDCVASALTGAVSRNEAIWR